MTISKTNQDSYYQTHQDRFAVILKNISNLKLSPKSSILDIGCYPLYLFQELEKQGYQLSGISSQHESVNQPSIKTLNIETTNFPYQDNSFDLVIFTEVIEHLTTNLDGIFKEIRRVLKPGGYVLLTTPNVLKIHNILSLLFNQNIYFSLDQLNQPINYRHQREYTLSEIKTLQEKVGLKPIIARTFTGYTPFRHKTVSDSFLIKFTKLLIYFFTCLFANRKDSIITIYQK
ncbi:MAG TPA: methyltransferase domain-containing protein [Candidatus Woesebacteria bacterium]|nr:methyltransferase domain-containing protein [Candidatus Woesebacteria bacterium]